MSLIDRQAVSFEPRIVLRPRSLDETFDLALRYARVYLLTFAKLVLPLVSIGLLAVAVAAYFGLEQQAALALAVLSAPFLERVVTVYAGRHLFQNSPRIAQAPLFALRRLPLGLLWALLQALPAGLLLLDADDNVLLASLVLAGCCWPFLLAFTPYLEEVLLLEQLPARTALVRTRALTEGRWARALGLVFLGYSTRVAAAAGASLGIRFLLGMILQFAVPDSIGGWAAIGGWWIGSAFVALVRLFDYVDARTRREGWDIQVLFNKVAQSHGERRAA